MATIQPQAIEIITPQKGVFIAYTEAASATFKRGELVAFSSGKIAALSGTDPTMASIVGIAMHDASGVTDDPVTVFVPDVDAIFSANLDPGSVTAVTDIGVRYGLEENSNIVNVDKTDTTNERVVVVALDKRDAVGDTQGRVWFKFLNDPMALTSNRLA